MKTSLYVPERSNQGLQLAWPKSVVKNCYSPMTDIDIAFIHHRIFLNSFFQLMICYQPKKTSH